MLAVLGLAVTIVVQIAGLAYWLGRKFAAIEERFREVRRRFEEVDKRFGEIDRRFSGVDERFKGIEQRFEEIDKRFEKLEQDLREEIKRALSAVASTATAMNSLVVDFLALKGLVTREERDFLRRQLESMASTIAPNPITKEEAEFLRKVFSKPEEEITIEELDKALEILKRWFFETGKEEAYKMYLYAYMFRASLYYERLRKERSAEK